MSDETLDVEFKPTAHDELPSILAARLYRHMRDVGWKMDRHRRGASEFKRLIADHGEQEVIRRVNGYIKYRIERPKVVAVQDFREHWDWIGDEIKKREAVTVESVSAAAKRIADELCPEDWPDRAKSQLPSAVQRSMDNYRALVQSLPVSSPDGDLREAALWMRDTELIDVEDYVASWFRSAIIWTRRTKNWNGGLSGLVWEPGHLRFVRECESGYEMWGGDTRAIRKLLGV